MWHSVFDDIFTFDLHIIYRVVKVTHYREDVDGEDEVGVYANKSDANKICEVLNSRQKPESCISYKVEEVHGDKEKIYNKFKSELGEKDTNA